MMVFSHAISSAPVISTHSKPYIMFFHMVSLFFHEFVKSLPVICTLKPLASAAFYDKHISAAFCMKKYFLLVFLLFRLNLLDYNLIWPTLILICKPMMSCSWFTFSVATINFTDLYHLTLLSYLLQDLSHALFLSLLFSVSVLVLLYLF